MKKSRTLPESSQEVIVLHNIPRTDTGNGDSCRESDVGVLDEVQAVAEALTRLGRRHSIVGVRRLTDIPPALSRETGRLVFNLVERLDGGLSDFNYVPAVCRSLGFTCTGGNSDSMSLTFDKWLTKARLNTAGILTPAGIALPPGAIWTGFPPAPVIVKPVSADGSEGVHADSVVRRAGPEVTERAARIHADFRQPALVERFIDGREFNISILERNGSVEILPLAEIDFTLFNAGRPPIVDYEVKWIPGTLGSIVSPRKLPAQVDGDTEQRIIRLARLAWAVCGCRDYARVDMRMDAEGSLYVIEINTNPDLSPRAGFPAALAAASISFEDFVAAVLANAETRR